MHQNWLYNSNYSCELSVVLTGAAFLHKVSSTISYMARYTLKLFDSIDSLTHFIFACEVGVGESFLGKKIAVKEPGRPP